MKYILLFTTLLTIQGCSIDEHSKEQKQKYKEWGATSNYFCDKQTGFLMKEYFWQRNSKIPTIIIIENDLDQPVRCGNATINVLETQNNTSRVF